MRAADRGEQKACARGEPSPHPHADTHRHAQVYAHAHAHAHVHAHVHLRIEIVYRSLSASSSARGPCLAASLAASFGSVGPDPAPADGRRRLRKPKLYLVGS